MSGLCGVAPCAVHSSGVRASDTRTASGSMAAVVGPVAPSSLAWATRATRVRRCRARTRILLVARVPLLTPSRLHPPPHPSAQTDTGAVPYGLVRFTLDERERGMSAWVGCGAGYLQLWRWAPVTLTDTNVEELRAAAQADSLAQEQARAARSAESVKRAAEAEALRAPPLVVDDVCEAADPTEVLATAVATGVVEAVATTPVAGLEGVTGQAEAAERAAGTLEALASNDDDPLRPMGASQPLRAAVARGPPSVALPTAAVRAQDVSLDDDGNGGGGGGGEVGGRNGGSGGGSTVAGAVVSELSSGSVAATAPSPYPQFTSIKDALRPVGGLPPPASASALNEEDCQGLLQGRRSGHREACGNGATDHASDEQAAHGSSHVTQTAYAEVSRHPLSLRFLLLARWHVPGLGSSVARARRTRPRACAHARFWPHASLPAVGLPAVMMPACSRHA